MLDVLQGPAVEPHRSHDLVVVVPGIMGSRLIDTESDGDRLIWGIRTALGGPPWRRRTSLRPLIVDDDERAGQRVRPAGLLSFPFWVPVLGGFEPYGELIRELRRTSVHREAILEFAYDWRLRVETNAARLATTLSVALDKWRQHPAQVQAARQHPEERQAQIVLVCHSMGGLVARALSTVSGGLDEVRAIVTIGTPFHGSLLALEMLADGGGGPFTLSQTALREVARTMPGVYDLLPSLPCLFDGQALHHLKPAEVAAVGADGGMARGALTARAGYRATALPGHRVIVGSAQATAQSAVLDGSRVTLQEHTYRRQRDGGLAADEIGRPYPVDYFGDGTVALHAGQVPGVEATAVAQQHGALARSSSVITMVREVARDIDLGLVLGGRDLGLTVPSAAAPDAPVPVLVRVDDDPHLVVVTVEDVNSPFRETYRRFRYADGDQLAFDVRFPAPGLYRVLASHGHDPVSSLVMVGTEPDDG